ncbi:Cellular retinaldehyde binding/alpha-tocopherol transport,CRAL/TRIO, N-terminal domain,CRAL-TRIO lipid [Cinara cedri]|uniref:Cellular retinaldehyde binding/alpha-tocopherol transport,CRAL/TRIO, N-terminal domain,CRAL-TRIO lipid n=1 Tax=Cinara cedri TaxID=506608 RepID=A0A5E4N1W6_9HEMI|nr:Cellular retinaldehyde binding/alpha-tocopherol transport,CRAL/TRIO, N-terminal domain,CRAL-TRIO lipid [Cinara cedri]
MEIDKDGNAVVKMASGYVLRFEGDPEFEQVYLDRAKNELNETPERRAEALAELRKLIQEEKNLYLPTDASTELYLLAYLRVCKFYPDSAFKRVKSLYKLRQKNPKYCSDLIPSIEKNVFEQNILTVLPLRDQHGRRIMITECGQRWKVKNCSLTEIFRGIELVMEAAILEPRTQVSGTVLLVDFIGLTINHVWQFTPNFAKLTLDWIQYSMPARLKEVHIVNQPYIFNMVFAMFKPFMQEKLRNRLFFHGYDHTSLLSYLDAKCLPTKYGGLMDIETNQGVDLWNLLCHYEDNYKVTNEFGYKKNK